MLRHLGWIAAWYVALASSVYASPTMYAGPTISVVYTYGAYGDSLIGLLLEDFAETTDVVVKAEYIGARDIKEKMMQSVTASQLPDAVIIPADQIALHKFFNYSVLDSAMFRHKVPSHLWVGGTSNNQLYGAPIIQGNHLMLYSNKALIPQVAASWEELLAQKNAIEKLGAASLVWNTKSSYLLYPFLDVYGGSPLQDGKLNLNTPAMVKALTFVNQLRVSHNLSTDCDYLCAKNAFMTGKAAYMIDGEWSAKEFARVFGDNLSISSIPPVGGNKVLSPASTYVIAFPRDGINGPKRELLIKLVDYLQSQSTQEKLWSQVSAIPVESGAFANAQAGAKGYLQQVLALMADTKSIPAEESLAFMWDIIRKSLIRHQAGGMTAEDTALYMQKLSDQYDKQERPVEQPLEKQKDAL